jgi:murein hydrolase activator
LFSILCNWINFARQKSVKKHIEALRTMGYKKLFFFFLFVLVSSICFGQSSAELKKRKAALSKEIEALKREQKQIAGTKRLSLKQIDALNAQIRLREDKISTINSEIHLLSSEIREKTNTVKSLQEQLQDLKKEYAARIRTES